MTLDGSLAKAALLISAIYGWQGSDVLEVSVEEPRPVSGALLQLEQRHGVVITYEDPRYEFAGDVRDVTEEVRQDLDDYPPGEAPRVLVPRSGSIRVKYDVAPETGNPPDMKAVVRAVLDSHERNGNPGVFRVMGTGGVLHVVPTHVRNRRGDLIATSSILDVVIALPKKERSGSAVVEEMCAALSRETGLTVIGGLMPHNLLSQHSVTLGTEGDLARDVLAELISGIGRKLSWQILYDPGLGWYVLSMQLLP